MDSFRITGQLNQKPKRVKSCLTVCKNLTSPLFIKYFIELVFIFKLLSDIATTLTNIGSGLLVMLAYPEV